MKIVGVRFPNGTARWVEADAWQVAPLDQVVVEVGGGRLRGVVFVTADQVANFHADVAGIIVHVETPRVLKSCGPFVEDEALPSLGSMVRVGGCAGRVVQVDPVTGRMTVTVDDGSSTDLRLCDLDH